MRDHKQFEHAVSMVRQVEKLTADNKKLLSIIKLLHEKESDTTLKSKCWQLADEFLGGHESAVDESN